MTARTDRTRQAARLPNSVAPGSDVGVPMSSPLAPGSPQVFIDGGDVPWFDLEPRLHHELAGLQSGEMLELQSGDPATIMTLPGWCAGEGYPLLHAQPGDGHVSFWIGRTLSSRLSA